MLPSAFILTDTAVISCLPEFFKLPLSQRRMNVKPHVEEEWKTILGRLGKWGTERSACYTRSIIDTVPLVKRDCSTCGVVDTVAHVTIRIAPQPHRYLHSRGRVCQKDDLGVETRHHIDMAVWMSSLPRIGPSLCHTASGCVRAGRPSVAPVIACPSPSPVPSGKQRHNLFLE